MHAMKHHRKEKLVTHLTHAESRSFEYARDVCGVEQGEGSCVAFDSFFPCEGRIGEAVHAVNGRIVHDHVPLCDAAGVGDESAPRGKMREQANADDRVECPCIERKTRKATDFEAGSTVAQKWLKPRPRGVRTAAKDNDAKAAGNEAGRELGVPSAHVEHASARGKIAQQFVDGARLLGEHPGADRAAEPLRIPLGRSLDIGVIRIRHPVFPAAHREPFAIGTAVGM